MLDIDTDAPATVAAQGLIATTLSLTAKTNDASAPACWGMRNLLST